MPKVTFLFNTIPLVFLKKDIAKLQGRIGSFIWTSKGSRTSWKKLRRRLEIGGLALPDMLAYCYAFQFKNVRMLANKVDKSMIGSLFEALLKDVPQGQQVFSVSMGTPNFLKR